MMRYNPEDKILLQLLFKPEQAKSGMLSDRKAAASLPEVNPDWNYLVETAQREGVAAVLFHNITKHHLEALVPPGKRQDLSNRYYANLKHNLSIIGALREVLAAFAEAGLPCILLKGIALAELVYPSLAMRGMGDVDLLIEKRDLFKADGRLSALGYTPRDSTAASAIHNPVGYLASLEYRKDDPSPLNLHLHWHPVNTSVPATMFAAKIDLSRLWANAVMTRVADSQALILRPEHMVIYLCEHALRVGHSFDRLILVCDLFYALKAFEKSINWDLLAEESRRLGLSRFVFFGLSIVKHYTSLDISSPWLARLKPGDISRGERLFLKLQLQNRRLRGSSYFIYLAMNRGIAHKARFIARTFFPPPQILLQRQHENGPPEPKSSIYLSRVREVFSHVLGLFARDQTETGK